MRLCLFAWITLALAALPVYGAEPAPRQSSAPPSMAKSVTVFPIVLTTDKPLPPGMAKKIAEVVGLLLERGGIKEIEVADAAFSPPKEGDPAKVAEAFGQFVRSQNLRTEYALFGQFLGTPGQGVDEIRLAVVDRQGKVLLSERRDRQQLSRLGEKKVDPMLASVHLVSRVRGLWGLGDPLREDAPQGKMAKLWDQDSGLPPRSEREAMQARLNGLKKTFKTSTVAVFPVRVSGNSDAKAAAGLAELLAKEELARAEAVSIDPKLQIRGNSNELRILWDTARAFQDFLRKNPPAADYALLADYGIGRWPDGKTGVGGVHFVLCDRKGEWVLVSLQNSHHADFQRIDPHSPDDCNRLVVEALKNGLR